MASVPNHPIPLEILFEAVSHISDIPTLLSLCLTSKAISNESSKHLYFDLSDGRLSSLNKHLKVLETITSNPALASFVGAYAIQFRHEGQGSDLERFWAILPKGLYLTTNLEYLLVTTRILTRSSYSMFDSVRFQLKWFCWWNGACAAEMDEKVAAFLATQRRLWWLCMNDDLSCPFPPSACQRVKTLEGSLATFTQILPGRPSITRIMHVAPSDSDKQHETLWNHEATFPEFKRITHLTVDWSDNVFQTWYRRASPAGSFSSVRIMQVRNLTRTFDFEDVCSMINPLPCLKTLVLLSGLRCEDGPSRTTASQLETGAMSVLQTCSSLDNIIVSIGFRPPKDKTLKEVGWPWRWTLVYLWLARATTSPRIVVWKHYRTHSNPKINDFCDLVDFHNGKTTRKPKLTIDKSHVWGPELIERFRRD